MEQPNRKKNRLADYDYNTPGAYFVTICTQNRKCILGHPVGGGALDAPHICLTKFGKIVQKYILSGNHIPGITVDKFVIMPNHVHLILIVANDEKGGTPRASSPTNAVIPHFVATMKRFCHRDIGERIFQRSYHDHIIRNEKDFQMIWQYIDTNPIRWTEDCFYEAME